MRAATSEFGTSETSIDVRYTAAFGGNADISAGGEAAVRS
jgi:hypothetical protein